MTKAEITEWVKSAKHVVTDYNEVDSDGNHYARDIFKSEGLYWAIEYVNGEMIPARRVSDSETIYSHLDKEHEYNPRQVRQERDLQYYYV